MNHAELLKKTLRNNKGTLKKSLKVTLKETLEETF